MSSSTPSTQPEVHNIAQCRWRWKTEPLIHATRIEKLGDVWTGGS